jgi:hypothetical protein
MDLRKCTEILKAFIYITTERPFNAKIKTNFIPFRLNRRAQIESDFMHELILTDLNIHPHI